MQYIFYSICMYIASHATRTPPVSKVSSGGHATPTPTPPHPPLAVAEGRAHIKGLWVDKGLNAPSVDFRSLIQLLFLFVVRKYLSADHHICALATICFCWVGSSGLLIIVHISLFKKMRKSLLLRWKCGSKHRYSFENALVHLNKKLIWDVNKHYQQYIWKVPKCIKVTSNLSTWTPSVLLCPSKV